MTRPNKSASQTSKIKIRKLHPVPFKTVHFNWLNFRNLLFSILWCTIIILSIRPQMLLAQNSSVQILPVPENAVQIIDCGNYYQVMMDYTTGISNYDMGVQLGKKILQAKPDYELLLDSYMDEMTHFLNLSSYSLYINRVHDIKPQMDQAYQDEIDGMASQFSGGEVNLVGDNKVSKDELYMIQLFSEVCRGTQCSGISVYGASSETGHPMTARILDWYGGDKHQFEQVQAVTTIIYSDKSTCLINGRKTISLIGYLGHLTLLTGFNCDGVFAGILDSGTGSQYSSTDKYSYTTDLRYALENSSTLNDVADYLTNPSRNYPFNYNVLLSDSQTSKVLENNFSGTGTNMQRALRSDISVLNPGITWGFTDAVATVNSFLMLGNHDNHTGNPSNMNRWESLKTQLQVYGDTVTSEELKQVASFDNDDGPGSSSTGDIYNSRTQQIVLFQPENFHLEVAFAPQSGILPADPVFETVPILWYKNQPYGYSLTMDKKAPMTVNDTITLNAVVENPYTDEISVQLIFESQDGAIIDSVEMFPVDLDINDSWQCTWIPESLPENFYLLSVKVTDIAAGTNLTSKNLNRITNIPLLISELTLQKAIDNRYSIKTQLKNGSKSTSISNLSIELSSNDNWVTTLSPDKVNLNGVRPGQIKRIPLSIVYVDQTTFPNYVDLTYTISKEGWPYWTFDTTLYVVTTGVEQIEVPLSLELEQNYPNPFNSVTTIPWQIAENSEVTLKVLDIVGRTVATLVDEQRQSGNYETQFNAATLPKGIYFCQLKAGENIRTRKMILLE